MSQISDTAAETYSKINKSRTQSEENEGVKGLRKSERIRTLTEKGKELHEEKLKNLQRRYKIVYEKWRYHARIGKEILRDEASEDELKDLIENVENSCSDVQNIYEELRQIQTPDPDMRRRVDLCMSLSAFIVKRARSQVKGHTSDEQEEAWPDLGSILNSTGSLSMPPSHRSQCGSNHSSIQSIKRNEAAAEAAASQEVLAVLEEQDKEAAEIQKLEAEEKQRLVQFEFENLTRQQAIQDKRRKLERLEEVKKLNAARARVKVYDQVEENSGSDNPMPDIKPLVQLQSPNSTMQTLNPSSPPFIAQSQTATNQALPTSPSIQNNSDFVSMLAEAITANRLPTPEPAVFSGDPLTFKDWQLSFETLIDRKAIPQKEKLYYLRKYVDGAAKKTIEGFFLLGTDVAYDSAWQLLEKRFGDPFIIGKSFRDKLDGWPKINPKSGCELREFADFLKSCEAATPHIKTLEVLNDCNENQRILLKLPDWLVSKWNSKVMEARQTNIEYPTFKVFVDFLSKEADLACHPISSVQALKTLQNEKQKHSRSQTIQAKTLSTNTTQSSITSCIFCKRTGHDLQRCRKFGEMTVHDRVKFVQAEKLCFGCLKVGHVSKMCNNKSTCVKCQKRHPTCLHDEKFRDSRSSTSKKERNPTETAATATTNRVIQDGVGTQTSAVVPVWVSSTRQPDKEILVYALLDTQSDTTFILEEVAEDLDTNKENVSLRLSTMSNKSTIIPCQKLSNLQVRGYNLKKRILLRSLYTREFIPADRSHIPTSQTALKWPHLEKLADKMPPSLECKVGLLIGYDCQQALLPKEILAGEENYPYAQRTDLGWSIVGCSNPKGHHADAIGTSHRVIVRQVIPMVQPSAELKATVHFVCKTQVKEISPADVIKALELDFTDHMTDDKTVSQEDILFLSKVTQGIRQKENGYYEIPLPFKTEKPCLPDNKQSAVYRLNSLEKRLKRDEQYYMDYVHFMNDIITRGDAEKVPETELDNKPAWYIPHHGVYHPHKPGKIRVVFDCSARFQETSLNDQLLTGPDLTNTLVGVLCRFRKGPIAIMCDIERMFHQFHVLKEHQDYLRFLWWDNGNLNSKPLVYRMRVHLFGAASSPGCSNFGLKYLASQGCGKFSKESIEFIQRSFYVDDGLISVESPAEAIHLVKESVSLCKTGNLRLHKFVSNSKDVVAVISPEERAHTKDFDMALGELHIERALGVQWCVEADEFQFRVTVKEKPLTRRGVLSTVASVYDPLGFVAPFVLIGKQILQELCKEKVSWDEELPEHIQPKWESWLRDLPRLAEFKIPRSHLPSNFGEVIQYELHNFSDASCNGYGACSYLRAISNAGQISCSLVMGKARVAPTRLMTIPRLELASAVVSVRNGDVVKSELEIENLQEYYWTDSKVVLGYVNNEAKRFHTFVANRIQRIRSSTIPEQWRHVNSESNPADAASRGFNAMQLKESNWLRGPEFLWKQIIPEEKMVGEIKMNDPELRKACVYLVETKEPSSIVNRLTKFSEWSRAVRAIARLKRFIKEFSGLQQRRNDTTSLEERREAEIFIIKLVQEEAFSNEIRKIKLLKKDTLGKRNKLYQLNAFLDNNNVLRVGGRLSHSALHHEVKHPAILPKKSHISALLVKHHHERVLHQGRGMTMNELRANGVWIIGCGGVVSSHIYKCTKCRRYRKATEVQQMADLPEERTETSPPFTYCGLDCFGPFIVKEGRKELKRYGLLFTCLCSRAVHIETLDDLTTDAFLNALRMFVAIRGPVRQLRCDQGTNFVGARRVFSDLLKGLDLERQKAIGCEFVMNVPSASHMGGVWERQIRTIRSILTVMLDKSASRLDTTTLRTFLYETMAIINSRPLSVEHLHDPTGPEPLTPNHILTMKSSIILPPPGQFCKEDLYLCKRWRRVQFLADDFWRRWKREYLLNLQQRRKWQRPSRNSQVNDIVILQDDNSPRNAWKLAKVVEAYPSADGLVRKLKLMISDNTFDKGKLRTRSVFLERPIHKVVTLLEAN
ncbi:uncharacterized protein LOC114471941 [Gouania willdenowi]|uniref:uncharacterized protein LOC114471941 n=1 Tax=Gouania willdenowi TaxID=441366 RepID=UPI001054AF8F|nr:uncharacterized protein LOC114471941 [Gouania willdenowi]